MINSCWACGGTSIRPFFAVEGMPLSSLILVDSQQDAVGFPSGGLELVVCETCGFVYNRSFQPELVDYTMPYESSQVFSPRFRAFADELIEHLVSDYDLTGKDVFEIGCGDASFLQELCRRAKARGFAIDPTFDAQRIDADVSVSGIAEFYDSDHIHLTGDLICCRHTLEHIQPVGEFVSLVRESAKKTKGCVVFFEIPDTERILDEGAFWDVYNEHCSYFTLTSLSHLFRSRGFQILRIDKGFDDQYLLIDVEVGPTDASNDRPAVDEIVTKADSFGLAASKAVDSWQRAIDSATAAGGKVVLWGASSKAVAFLAAIDRDDSVAAAVDINPFKQEKFLPGSGIPVIPPEELEELDPDLVIVMNPIYRTEIEDNLQALGLDPTTHALGDELEERQTA